MPPEEDVSAPTASSEPSSAPAPAAPESAPSTPSIPQSSEPTTEASGSSKETLLDAVLKVVPATNEKDVLAETTEQASPETPDATTQPKDGQADPAAPEGDDDDDAEPTAEAASPVIRKKINKLLKQRRELRNEVQQLQALKPTAEIGQQMQSFAKQNDLSGDDVANVLKIAAFIRAGDYQSFYTAISPFVRTAQEYLGIALPKDLRDRVSAGDLTENAAKEFARIRMDKQRIETTRTAEQQTFAKRHIQSTQEQVQRSVSAFEERLAANDPDYKAKAASVLRTAQAMLFERGGKITDVKEALAITKAAYDEVNATIRRQRPAPHATAKYPNGNGQTRSARPEPASLMEAALQGLANARNGA